MVYENCVDILNKKYTKNRNSHAAAYGIIRTLINNFPIVTIRTTPTRFATFILNDKSAFYTNIVTYMCKYI